MRRIEKYENYEARFYELEAKETLTDAELEEIAFLYNAICEYNQYL